jgi:hypothetical protein
MNVIVLPWVLDYLKELSETLYQKEYFGFRETAEKYGMELLDEIHEQLPKRLHKSAPSHFDRYGKDMDYAVFRKNRNTSWYVFFTTYEVEKEVFYLVRYIANNHTIAQYL